MTAKQARARTCAACGREASGEYSIHRDGMGEGPDVDLCTWCGQGETPTCEELWKAIAKRRTVVMKAEKKA